MINIEQVKQWAISRWKLGELHGLSHWERVEHNGQLLATPECDLTVIRLFAYLHDSCRESDGYDEQHGPRAAKMMNSLRHTLLNELTDHQFELLQTPVISIPPPIAQATQLSMPDSMPTASTLEE